MLGARDSSAPGSALVSHCAFCIEFMVLVTIHKILKGLGLAHLRDQLSAHVILPQLWSLPAFELDPSHYKREGVANGAFSVGSRTLNLAPPWSEIVQIW